jgi:hypothetical protein
LLPELVRIREIRAIDVLGRVQKLNPVQIGSKIQIDEIAGNGFFQIVIEAENKGIFRTQLLVE